MSPERIHELTVSKSEVVRYLVSDINNPKANKAEIVVLTEREEEDLSNLLDRLGKITRIQHIPTMKIVGQNRGLTPRDLNNIFQIIDRRESTLEADILELNDIDCALGDIFYTRSYEIARAMGEALPSLQIDEIYPAREIFETVGKIRAEVKSTSELKSELLKNKNIHIQSLIAIMLPIIAIALPYFGVKYAESTEGFDILSGLATFFLSIIVALGIGIMDVALILEIAETRGKVKDTVNTLEKEETPWVLEQLGRNGFKKQDFDKTKLNDLLPAYPLSEAIKAANEACKDILGKGFSQLDSDTISSLAKQKLTLEKLKEATHKYPRKLPKGSSPTETELSSEAAIREATKAIQKHTQRLVADAEVERAADKVRSRPRMRQGN